VEKQVILDNLIELSIYHRVNHTLPSTLFGFADFVLMASGPERAKSLASKQTEREDGFDTSKPRILIVDDHDLVRAGLVALLEASWDVCGEAGNGIEAIEKVRELKPDMVLLDLSMPLMSGTQAAKSIRAISPRTKIVFLSMHDSPTVAELVKTMGADGFISKHSQAGKFRKELAALLDHTR
jgi:CheY-like chemotaxis protein